MHLFSRYLSTRRAVAAIFLFLLLWAAPLAAQTSVYPDVLYTGMNHLTFRAASGLAKIEWRHMGEWKPVITGTNTSLYRVISSPGFSRCAKQATCMILVKTMRPAVKLRFRVTDCEGETETFDVDTDEIWNVYREDYGKVTLGQTVCHKFTVYSEGGNYVVESVASPSPLFTLRYPNGRPPLTVRAGTRWTYDVCFKATKTGQMKMPILVYMRRRQPAGGLTSFIVADTAYANVVLPPGATAPRPVPPRPTPPRPRPTPPRPTPPRPTPPRPTPPRPTPPRPTPPRPTPPRPTPPRPRPTPPRPRPTPPRPTPPRPRPTPPRPAPPRVDTPRVVPPRAMARVQPVELRATEPAVYGRVPTFIPPVPIDAPDVVTDLLSDPTTFRTIVMPTARSMEEGETFLASYDLAAVVAGYGLTDRITLLGGFLYVPAAVASPLLDVTAGGRYEFYREGMIRSAAGVQLNYSRSDSSAIALAAPYIVTSIGDDDRRGSLVVGYSMRRHQPLGPGTTGRDPFERQALILGIGGDYRIGHHWKIAGEGYLLQDSDYQPIIVTLRYFDETFALDFGLGINPRLLEGNINGLGIAPVVSGVWVF